MNGAASATATVGAVTVRLTSKRRGAEGAGEQRQQRLRGVEIEKRGEAGENRPGSESAARRIEYIVCRDETPPHLRFIVSP